MWSEGGKEIMIIKLKPEWQIIIDQRLNNDWCLWCGNKKVIGSKLSSRDYGLPLEIDIYIMCRNHRYCQECGHKDLYKIVIPKFLKELTYKRG